MCLVVSTLLPSVCVLNLRPGILKHFRRNEIVNGNFISEFHYSEPTDVYDMIK